MDDRPKLMKLVHGGESPNRVKYECAVGRGNLGLVFPDSSGSDGDGDGRGPKARYCDDLVGGGGASLVPEAAEAIAAAKIPQAQSQATAAGAYAGVGASDDGGGLQVNHFGDFTVSIETRRRPSIKCHSQGRGPARRKNAHPKRMVNLKHEGSPSGESFQPERSTSPTSVEGQPKRTGRRVRAGIYPVEIDEEERAGSSTHADPWIGSSSLPVGVVTKDLRPSCDQV
ncbi:hypothetical protein B0T21DRAFT_345506 [Apiosordaria backusii]|uniref:Uncharacterized protein n=1 Tax=Apiosordaria backusii TaxID=314023 RepID=A0AA40ELL4_9PEZI|nr:hypothetical protein B0T21DRAFT_345506 [Apiosordaria backusii]